MRKHDSGAIAKSMCLHIGQRSTSSSSSFVHALAGNRLQTFNRNHPVREAIIWLVSIIQIEWFVLVVYDCAFAVLSCEVSSGSSVLPLVLSFGVLSFELMLSRLQSLGWWHCTCTLHWKESWPQAPKILGSSVPVGCAGCCKLWWKHPWNTRDCSKWDWQSARFWQNLSGCKFRIQNSRFPTCVRANCNTSSCFQGERVEKIGGELKRRSRRDGVVWMKFCQTKLQRWNDLA